MDFFNICSTSNTTFDIKILSVVVICSNSNRADRLTPGKDLNMMTRTQFIYEDKINQTIHSSYQSFTLRSSTCKITDYMVDLPVSSSTTIILKMIYPFDIDNHFQLTLYALV